MGLLQRCKELQDVIAILGLEELSDPDKRVATAGASTGHAKLSDSFRNPFLLRRFLPECLAGMWI